jgi:hypothetical protein
MGPAYYSWAYVTFSRPQHKSRFNQPAPVSGAGFSCRSVFNMFIHHGFTKIVRRYYQRHLSVRRPPTIVRSTGTLKDSYRVLRPVASRVLNLGG